MSDTIYIWGARSKSSNHVFHEMNPGQKLVTNRSLAQRFADSFATRLNANNHMQKNDWQPVVENRSRLPGTSDLQ